MSSMELTGRLVLPVFWLFRLGVPAMFCGIKVVGSVVKGSYGRS